QWFTRAEVLDALDRGEEWLRGMPEPDGAGRAVADGEEAPRLLLPGSISIARALVEAWARTPA
ncbi:hypothetical protein GOOTI_232_00010, partial [Gordonia otitidis NBRC 100426]